MPFKEKEILIADLFDVHVRSLSDLNISRELKERVKRLISEARYVITRNVIDTTLP